MSRRASISAAPSTAVWPCRFPYIARHSFSQEPIEGQPKFAKLEVNDYGEVLEFHIHTDDSQWLRVTIPRKGSEATGWVPWNRVEVGTKRMYGDIITITDLPKAPESFQVAVPETGQLHRALCALMQVIHRGRTEMGLWMIPDHFNTAIRNGNGIEDAATRIVRGVEQVDRKMKAAFDKTNFSLRDIQSATPPTISSLTSGDMRSLVYIRVYSDFIHDQRKLPVIIPGKCVQASQRVHQHEQATSGDKPLDSTHYRLARLARRRESIPICIEAEEDWRTTIEQFFILLLESQRPGLLYTPGQDGCITDVVGRDGQPRSERESQRILDREAATLLAEAADLAREQSGWPGGCRSRPRTSFMTGGETSSFGSIEGLNWNSPWTEANRHEKVLWTRMDRPGKMASFRRPAVTVWSRKVVGNVRKTAFKITKWSESDKQRKSTTFTCDIPNDQKEPKVGRKVFPVFEITLDNTPHPVPLARLPTVGNFSDWHLANQIALRLEYQDDSENWHSLWIQRRPTAENEDAVYPGSLPSWNVAIGLRRFFLQQTCSNPFPWQFNLGVARIKDITWDHLGQAVRILERVPRPQDVVLRPATRQLSQIRQGLRDAGLNVPNPPGNWQGYLPGAVRRRSHKGYTIKKCDCCELRAYRPDARRVNINCIQAPGLQDCTNCIIIGRPCSWTGFELLDEDSPRGAKARNAVWFLPATPGAVEIDDPDHITFGRSQD